MGKEILERNRADATTPHSEFDEVIRRALVTYSQTRRGFLETMERFFLGMLGVAVIPGLPRLRTQAKGNGSAGPIAVVALTAQFAGGEPFTLAVPKATHEHRVLGVVWVPGEQQRMGVRITPQPDTGAGTIHVEFVGVRGDLKTLTSCQELAKLGGIPLGSYDLTKGSPIHIGSSKEFPMPDLSVSLIPVNDFHGCCTCGKLACCPQPGQCLGCGGCGTCWQVATVRT